MIALCDTTIFDQAVLSLKHLWHRLVAIEWLKSSGAVRRILEGGLQVAESTHGADTYYRLAASVQAVLQVRCRHALSIGAA